ncbi:ATP-binding cassette domain-containing protein [Roseobacter sp. HKCCA0434]|uniref:ATP-binding cassette domain-containing protein n=1 Tax=Roseobacter sp. HKCCA0434 TaxID=3079297 RepID=UPI002905EA1E|nr:ATP-binding cassette domain-containing protein [Roseobacter sp. HKCCA0434]
MSRLLLQGRIEKRDFALDVDIASDAPITVLHGPSGAGKTLTLHLAAGLVEAVRPRCVVQGADLTALPTERRPLAMAFQEPRLFPHLDVKANLAYGARGADPAALADALDLGPLLHRRPADLSGGQAQRVSLMRALLRPARLVLLDEPFTGLDADRREAARDLIRRRAASGDVILMVSHDPADARTLEAQVVTLRDGAAR